MSGTNAWIVSPSCRTNFCRGVATTTQKPLRAQRRASSAINTDLPAPINAETTGRSARRGPPSSGSICRPSAGRTASKARACQARKGRGGPSGIGKSGRGVCRGGLASVGRSRRARTPASGGGKSADGAALRRPCAAFCAVLAASAAVPLTPGRPAATRRAERRSAAAVALSRSAAWVDDAAKSRQARALRLTSAASAGVNDGPAFTSHPSRIRPPRAECRHSACFGRRP